MSEIRINIIDNSQTISGDIHGSFGDVIVTSLTAEPETIEELETAIQRFIKRESDWSFFRGFRKGENFEPFDAGLLVIDLAAWVVMADSTYSYYSTEGKIPIKTDETDDFPLPYWLSDDWKYVSSMPEFEGVAKGRREERLKNQPIDVREILFGKLLCSFIAAEYLANKNATDEDLFNNIHAKWLMTARDDLRGINCDDCRVRSPAKWLMTARDDLRGQTPREVLLEKQDFISSDLHSRFLQWSFTKFQPPPLSKDTNAYKFAGFGTNEIVVYYDLFRFLLGECFEHNITRIEQIEQLSEAWLTNPNDEFSGRTPRKIVESERRRINLTLSAHECLVDEDCEICEKMAVEFIDVPMIWGLDGSEMGSDRFEFSFSKTLEEWEAKQREMEEFNLEFAEGKRQEDNDLADFDEELF